MRLPARWWLLIFAVAVAVNVAALVRDEIAQGSPTVANGGPLSPCPGYSHFDNRYRATFSGGLVRRGCATAYSQNEYLDGGGNVACGGRLDDRAYTTAVSANVPVLNDSRGRIRCGLKVKVCGARCVVVKVNDRGPYVLSDGGDFGRDFDLSYAAALRIGKSARAWGDPVIVWYRLCSPATPVGAERCAL